MFALQNAPADRARLPGLDAASRCAPETGTAKFDLTLVARGDAGRASTGTLEYSTDLFDAATVERLAGALRACCWRRVAATRERGCPSCRCCTEAERQQLLVDVERHRVPATRATPPARSSSRRRPRARRTRVAVESDGAATLTYARARRARQPAGAPPARAWASGPDVARRPVPGALAGDGGRRCSASSRRAAPTCRSTRTTRASGWRCMLRGRAARRCSLTAGAACAAALPARRGRLVLPGRRMRELASQPATTPRPASAPPSTWPTSSTPRAPPAGPRA